MAIFVTGPVPSPTPVPPPGRQKVSEPRAEYNTIEMNATTGILLDWKISQPKQKQKKNKKNRPSIYTRVHCERDEKKDKRTDHDLSSEQSWHPILSPPFTVLSRLSSDDKEQRPLRIKQKTQRRELCVPFIYRMVYIENETDSQTCAGMPIAGLKIATGPPCINKSTHRWAPLYERGQTSPQTRRSTVRFIDPQVDDIDGWDD